MLNVYKRFKALVANPPRLVGDVVAYSAGLATIITPDGAEMTALGEAEFGDRVFFRDGVIEGPAPILPYGEDEV